MRKKRLICRFMKMAGINNSTLMFVNMMASIFLIFYRNAMGQLPKLTLEHGLLGC